MKRFCFGRSAAIVFFVFILSSSAGVAFACSRVFWNTNSQAKVSGRSVDSSYSEEPQMVAYPKGMERDGGAGGNSARWKSTYGSVVVTAFGTNTNDGMNEKGLVAHVLYLDGAKYEPRDGRPGVAMGQWIQFILDNFSTVDEALLGLKEIQIVPKEVGGKVWPLHVAIEDATGDSAVIEYIEGKMNVYHGAQYSVMTNEPPLNKQLKNLRRYKMFGGRLPMPGDIDPASRFVRASSYLLTLPEPKDAKEAVVNLVSLFRSISTPFGSLDTSGTKYVDSWPTRWLAVADATNLTYYFSYTWSPSMFWVDLKKVNLREGAPPCALDPANPNLSGDVSGELKAIEKEVRGN